MSLPGRIAGLLLASGMTLVAGIALAPASSAAPSPAPVTTLSFTPASGLDITPMYVIVPQPCPAAATNVVAMAVGYGFPAGGAPVVNNSTSGISHTAPFILPLQDTFAGFAMTSGTKLRGSYAVTLRCSNRLGSKTYASFSGTVKFSDATHYTAPVPARSVVAAIAASQIPSDGPAATPSTGSGASAQPKASAGGAQDAKGQSTTGPSLASGSAGPTTKTAASAPAAKKSSDAWQPILVFAALLLIAGAIVLRIREVRRGRQPGGTNPSSADSASVDEILTLANEGEPAKSKSSPGTRA